MTSKNEYIAYCKRMEDRSREYHKNMASWLLSLPCPMSYEVWQALQELKGDLG